MSSPPRSSTQQNFTHSHQAHEWEVHCEQASGVSHALQNFSSTPKKGSLAKRHYANNSTWRKKIHISTFKITFHNSSHFLWKQDQMFVRTCLNIFSLSKRKVEDKKKKRKKFSAATRQERLSPSLPNPSIMHIEWTWCNKNISKCFLIHSLI